MELRRLTESDSFEELTELLHRAYAPLAAAGMRFFASHQDADATRRRATDPGHECWVGEREGALVATITLCYPGPGHMVEYYARERVAMFTQFCVEPSLQGRGHGSRLLELVERRAAELGARELACDTSEHADHLLRLYAARGYRRVGTADWEVTNYRSVILAKPLPSAPMQAEIHVTAWCPFCVRAKQILEREGIPFEEHVYSGNDAALREVKQRYSHPTVPIILLDGEFIGGCNELEELQRAGRLQGGS